MRPSLLWALSLGCVGCLSQAWVSGSPSSATDAGEADLGDGGPVDTFAQLQRDIFAGSCAFAGCHHAPSPAAHCQLDGPSACAGMVGVPSCLFPAKRLVAPGDPANSVLLDTMLGLHLDQTPDPACGRSNVQMPLGAAPLPADQVERVRRWIAAGASCGTPADGGSGGDAGEPSVHTLTALPDAGPLLAGSMIELAVTLQGPAPAQGVQIALTTSDATLLAVPSLLFVPGGSTRVTFSVEAKRPGTASVLASSGGATAALTLVAQGLYLSEVFFDPLSGNADGVQWIKLYNASVFAIDLSKYGIGAGQTRYVETTATLQGTLAPGACALIGGPASTADNAWPVYTQTFYFFPNLPLAPLQGSSFGVALFDQPPGVFSETSVPLDALWVGSSANPTLPGAGTPLVAPPDAGASLARNVPGPWSAVFPPQPATCPNP